MQVLFRCLPNAFHDFFSLLGPTALSRSHLEPDYFVPTPAASAFGLSSPVGGRTSGLLGRILRTAPNKSPIFMPLRVSNRAGTCAAISVMSPVILLMPAE